MPNGSTRSWIGSRSWPTRTIPTAKYLLIFAVGCADRPRSRFPVSAGCSATYQTIRRIAPLIVRSWPPAPAAYILPSAA